MPKPKHGDRDMTVSRRDAILTGLAALIPAGAAGGGSRVVNGIQLLRADTRDEVYPNMPHFLIRASALESLAVRMQTNGTAVAIFNKFTTYDWNGRNITEGRGGQQAIGLARNFRFADGWLLADAEFTEPEPAQQIRQRAAIVAPAIIADHTDGAVVGIREVSELAIVSFEKAPWATYRA